MEWKSRPGLPRHTWLWSVKAAQPRTELGVGTTRPKSRTMKAARRNSAML